MSRELNLTLSIEIEDSDISDEGLRDLIYRGAVSGLQQAGQLGLVDANVRLHQDTDDD